VLTLRTRSEILRRRYVGSSSAARASVRPPVVAEEGEHRRLVRLQHVQPDTRERRSEGQHDSDHDQKTGLRCDAAEEQQHAEQSHDDDHGGQEASRGEPTTFADCLRLVLDHGAHG